MKINNLNKIQFVAPINSDDKTTKSVLNNNIICNNQTFDRKMPSLHNLKANYLVSFGVERSFNRPEVGSRKNEEKYLNIPFYEKNANDLAILLGPDKDAILTYDDKTALPELSFHRFASNVKNGNYRKQGFQPDTNIVIFSPTDWIRINKDPEVALRTAINKLPDPEAKTVVLIKDMRTYLEYTVGNKDAHSLYSGKFLGDNVQIVGLMDNSSYQEIKESSSIKKDINFLKLFGTVNLSVPGETETKEILKKQGKILNTIIKRYEPTKVTISDNAIDKAVDLSAQKIGGEFPGKALNVIDLVISAKVNEVKQKNPNNPISVNSSDVTRFFEKHYGILESLVDKNSQFKKVEIPKTRFSDVGGASDVKEILKDGILAYIKNPKEYLKHNTKAPKGTLFYGGPGTGKTLLARALAGEAGVPFFNATGSDFVEVYVGKGAARVRELFREAKKAAESSDKKTAIIFIDEIDAVAKKRGNGEGGGAQEHDNTLNALLAEMDGYNKDSKTHVIVIGATNRKDILDPAILRPGRFDDSLEVPNPTRNTNSRLEILKIHTKNAPFKDAADKEKIINEAAIISAGLSGAELADMVSKAAKVATKRENDKFITHNDLIEGYLQVKAGPIKHSDESDLIKTVTVAHECGHASTGIILNHILKQDISFITQQERGNFLGAVFYKPGKDMGQPNFDSVIASAAMSYAGGIAESRFQSGGHDAGVSGDLSNATELIEKAVENWGLGPNVGFTKVTDKNRDLYKTEIKDDVRLFTKTAEKISRLITDYNRDFISKYVVDYKANIGKAGKTLSGEEFKKLHDEWLKKSGKDKEEPLLQQKISILIDSARNGKILTDEELDNKIKNK
ncbi:MAG: AAA family ATPase [bacterium]